MHTSPAVAAKGGRLVVANFSVNVVGAVLGRVGGLDEALAVEYKNVLEPDSISAILDRRNSREELF